NHKKVTFLREVVRALDFADVEVYAGRAEAYAASPSGVVTLRAVERYEAILPVAALMVRTTGTLALLIAARQVDTAHSLLARFRWQEALPIPLSSQRVLLQGTAP